MAFHVDRNTACSIVLCGLIFFVTVSSVHAESPPERLNDQFLSTIDPNGEIAKGILASTGAERIVDLSSLYFVRASHCDVMFLKVTLKRLAGVGGIPEAVMIAGLFIMRDEVNGKMRIRVANDTFRLDENPVRSIEQILGNIDNQDMSKIKFDYEHFDP